MTFEKENLLEDGETMVGTIRKHWIVYLHDFFLHAFGCLIFLISAYYLASRGSFGGIYATETSYGAMILTMFVLIFWTSFFYAWTKDYFDVWYVTNEHIIAINQKEIFARDEAFMELERIQDVLFEKDGLLSTIFGYGRLKVQSAGTDQQFIMEYVDDVEAAAHRIMELRDEAQEKGRRTVTGEQ
jgi:uncharacterized membrane protein YdbT with pleckstrin-like domain